MHRDQAATPRHVPGPALARRSRQGALGLAILLVSMTGAHAQVRAPEPMPRHAEQTQWRDPRPTDPPSAVRPRAPDVRLDQAQRRLDAQRTTIMRDRQHADRMRTLGATPQGRQAELATQRQQQAEARQRAGLLRERDAAARDARLREVPQPQPQPLRPTPPRR